MLNGTHLIPGAASTTKNTSSDESYSELFESTVSVSISDEVSTGVGYHCNAMTRVIHAFLNSVFGICESL